MNAGINKLLATLKRHIWLLAAFFLPLAIRSIPEIISWPYPLGLDTLRYIPMIESGDALSSVPVFFQYQLFYPLGSLANLLLGDGILTVKILGPILMGLVALMMYFYAKRGLGWSDFKSFLVSLLVGIYFVALRNSWDLYAQSLGLVFLFAALIALKSSMSPKRFGYAFVFILLTVLSHQLVSVILFFILGLDALRFLYKKCYRDSVYAIISLSFAGGLFLLKAYSEVTGTFIMPTAEAVFEPSLSFAPTFVGLMLYGYGLLLPLVAWGLMRVKDWFMRFWVLWCFGASVLLIILPSLPLYYWNRWFYLLVYPLLFLAVEGLERLYLFWYNKKNVIRRRLPKVIAVLYIALLLVLSGFYISQRPENQISFFSIDNPYLTFIPSSMLQNTISITDNPGLVSCFDWINSNSNNSTLVIHYALYDLAHIYVHNNIVNVNHPASLYESVQNTNMTDNLVDASKKAVESSNSTVYTVWWISGKGWYEIPSLPPEFIEVYRADEMAVYVFTGGN